MTLDDIKTVGIELSVVLRAVKQAASMLEAGSTQDRGAR